MPAASTPTPAPAKAGPAVVTPPSSSLAPITTAATVSAPAVLNQQTSGASLRIGGVEIKTVSDRAQAKEIVSALIAANVERVAVDCEGIDLGANGKLCLIQLTAKAHPIYLFSLVEDSEIVQDLKLLLEHPQIQKVLHDCRQDVAALKALGVRLCPLNDTQKMWDMLQELKNRVDNAGAESWTSVVSKEKRIGLNQLLAAFKMFWIFFS
eukprot:TRINITY_DN1200_c0_g1_i2.p1 TRINITY_DN1200_c0_g1~~TRINITY_DN1200_c0_g1_i2.p1  ORF type:complete len:209 (+),score=44.43 TRINITY_DN1200_c0_g1_i2:1163-1789(+)